MLDYDYPVSATELEKSNLRKNALIIAAHRVLSRHASLAYLNDLRESWKKRSKCAGSISYFPLPRAGVSRRKNIEYPAR